MLWHTAKVGSFQGRWGTRKLDQTFFDLFELALNTESCDFMVPDCHDCSQFSCLIDLTDFCDKPRRVAEYSWIFMNMQEYSGILCSNRCSHFATMKSGFHPTYYLNLDVFLTFSSFTPLKGGCFGGGFLCVGRLDSCRDHGSSDEQEKLYIWNRSAL